MRKTSSLSSHRTEARQKCAKKSTVLCWAKFFSSLPPLCVHVYAVPDKKNLPIYGRKYRIQAV